jgi:hypothetical protein
MMLYEPICGGFILRFFGNRLYFHTVTGHRFFRVGRKLALAAERDSCGRWHIQQRLLPSYRLVR